MTDWRNVTGYPGYQVSSAGQVRSLMRKTPRILSPDVGHSGHQRVTLSSGDGIYTRVFVHRLVLMEFVGAPPEGRPIADHVDRDPANNQVTNLRWCSLSENNRNRPALGVSWVEHKKHWRARIRKDGGAKVSLGVFKNKSEAIEAYRKARRIHHGAFACES